MSTTTNKEKLPSKCIPCEGKVSPLPSDKIKTLISEYHGWELVEDKKLVKEFKFSNFTDAKWFLDIVSAIAEEQGHHPTMTIIYNKLKVTLTTHAAGGLTENDFIMAALIEEANTV
jgi:4a-hydroxytetrahydrobiopterin dehydratase